MLRACENKSCCTSTFIDGSLTFGWGKLGQLGDWEFPCVICERAWLDRFENSDKMAKEIRSILRDVYIKFRYNAKTKTFSFPQPNTNDGLRAARKILHSLVPAKKLPFLTFEEGTDRLLAKITIRDHAYAPATPYGFTVVKASEINTTPTNVPPEWSAVLGTSGVLAYIASPDLAAKVTNMLASKILTVEEKPSSLIC